MKNILLLFLPILSIVSCSKETGNNIMQDDGEIQFNIEIPQTKASMLGFETGDSLSLYAVVKDSPLQIGGNFFNNEKLLYNGSKWVGERKLYWSDVACDFYAIYPYQSKINSIESYSYHINADQSGNGYDLSDLMYASKMNVSRSDGSVNLRFSHIMSKLVVRLVRGVEFEGDIPDDSKVFVYNTLTSCDVNLSDGTVAIDSFADRKKITMHKIDNSTFEAILVPQNIEKRTPLIEVTMGGISYLLEYSMSFRKGSQHTITLTVNTSPDQENIEIGVNPGVNDW